MPPKDVKKKKGGSKRYASTMPKFTFELPMLGPKASEYVRCRICCTALNHLDFQWPAVPTEVSLSAIKTAICARHSGAVPFNLRIYKDQVHPDSLIGDVEDSTTLRDLGVVGLESGTPEELPTVTLYYDFDASRPDDPIVSLEVSGQPSKHGLDLKAWRRIEARTRP